MIQAYFHEIVNRDLQWIIPTKTGFHYVTNNDIVPIPILYTEWKIPVLSHSNNTSWKIEGLLLSGSKSMEVLEIQLYII